LIVAEKNATKNILDGRKDGQTDRGKTVYPPSPPGSGGIIIGMHTTGMSFKAIGCQMGYHYTVVRMNNFFKTPDLNTQIRSMNILNFE
jgi:hypothetical protein